MEPWSKVWFAIKLLKKAVLKPGLRLVAEVVGPTFMPFLRDTLGPVPGNIVLYGRKSCCPWY